ncbi:glycosyltransferase [Vibrio mimicus]
MRDLIVFGEDFGGLPSSTQHLILQLSRERKVLWINSIGLRQPKLNWRDIARVWQKLRGQTRQTYSTQVTPPAQIQVVNLRTIPAPRSSWARALAKTAMLTQLKPILRRAQLNQPILWSSLPTAADLCGELGESAVVYYCGDDFAALDGVDHDTVAQHEDRLVNHAQLILAASQELQQKFPAQKTHFLPHGVDLKLFTTPAERAHDLPNNGRPIAGFYGSLSEWLDCKMLNHVTAALPDWNFVFIGPNKLEKEALVLKENVYLLGSRPHHQLPSYCQHWDVSLLPFKLNEQIRACSPLKLMEYLAIGKPILSSPYPAALRYQDQLHLVSNAQQMITALSRYRSLSPSSPQCVTQDSWHSRSMWLSNLLEQL